MVGKTAPTRAGKRNVGWAIHARQGVNRPDNVRIMAHMTTCKACGEPLACKACGHVVGSPTLPPRIINRLDHLTGCFIHVMQTESNWPGDSEFLVSKPRLLELMRGVFKFASVPYNPHSGALVRYRGLRLSVQEIYGNLLCLMANPETDNDVLGFDKRGNRYPVWNRQITNGKRFVVFPPWNLLFEDVRSTDIGFLFDSIATLWVYPKNDNGDVVCEDDKPLLLFHEPRTFEPTTQQATPEPTTPEPTTQLPDYIMRAVRRQAEQAERKRQVTAEQLYREALKPKPRYQVVQDLCILLDCDDAVAERLYDTYCVDGGKPLGEPTDNIGIGSCVVNGVDVQWHRFFHALPLIMCATRQDDGVWKTDVPVVFGMSYYTTESDNPVIDWFRVVADEKTVQPVEIDGVTPRNTLFSFPIARNA